MQDLRPRPGSVGGAWRRTALVERLRSAALDGRSALVAGPSGSGRTHLLDQVAEDLIDAGRAVRRVHGVDGASGVPLAPAAALVQELGGDPERPLTVYTQLPVRALEAGITLVVDDVGLLDAASGVLLGQLVRAGVPLLLAVRDEGDLPGALADAVRGAGWVREELESLASDDVLALAAALCGDELTAGSAARVLDRAQGLVGLVVEAVRRGSVGSTSGPAGTELGPDLVGPRARRLVAQRLDGLSTAAVDLLDLLSVGGPLPRAVLEGEPVEELRVHDLVRTADDDASGDEVVVVRTTLVADVRTTEVGPGGVLGRRRAAAALLRDRPGWEGAVALLDLRCGLRVAPTMLELGAERALAAHRPAEAVELLAAVPEQADPGDAVRLTLLRGVAASAAGDLEVAADLLDRCRDGLAAASSAPPPALVLRLGQEVGLLHAVRRADPPRAVADVEEVVRLADEEGVREALGAELVKWRLMAGLAPVAVGDRPPDAETLRAADEAAQVSGALIGAMVASLDGPLADVEPLVVTGLAAAARATAAPPFAADLLRLSAYLGAAFDGRLEQAEQEALAHRDRAARTAHPSLGMWEYAAAELALHAGRVERCAAMVARAQRHLAWHDFTGLQPAARALAAAAESRRGRAAAARRLAEQVPDDARADVKVELHLARVAADAHLARRDRRAAAQALAEAGHRAVGEVHRFLGVMALDEAFTLHPGEQFAEALAAHADRSPLTEVLARRARAVLDRDPDELETCAEELAAMRLVGRAAWTARTAAALPGTGGERARRLERRAAVLLAEHQADAWPDRAEGALTPRELEIATLAARRTRSREIAAALDLSVRTVDNHLARIFRKLDVSGRDELAAALGLAEEEGVGSA